MIRWSTEMGCYQPPFSGGWNTSVSERPVDRAFESHQPHLFFIIFFRNALDFINADFK